MLWGDFNETVIPLALVGYEMFTANEVRSISHSTCARGIIIKYPMLVINSPVLFEFRLCVWRNTRVLVFSCSRLRIPAYCSKTNSISQKDFFSSSLEYHLPSCLEARDTSKLRTLAYCSKKKFH